MRPCPVVSLPVGPAVAGSRQRAELGAAGGTVALESPVAVPKFRNPRLYLRPQQVPCDRLLNRPRAVSKRRQM